MFHLVLHPILGVNTGTSGVDARNFGAYQNTQGSGVTLGLRVQHPKFGVDRGVDTELWMSTVNISVFTPNTRCKHPFFRVYTLQSTAARGRMAHSRSSAGGLFLHYTLLSSALHCTCTVPALYLNCALYTILNRTGERSSAVTVQVQYRYSAAQKTAKYTVRIGLLCTARLRVRAHSTINIARSSVRHMGQILLSNFFFFLIAICLLFTDSQFCEVEA